MAQRHRRITIRRVSIKTSLRRIRKQLEKTIAKLTKYDATAAEEISNSLAAFRNQRQQVEVQVKRAALQLEFHLENLPLAILEWDRQSLKRWSPQAEKIFGWKAEEVIGQEWQNWRFIFEEDLETTHTVCTRLLEGHEPHNVNYNRNYTKDGSVIHCEWYNSVLFDRSGNIKSILSFARDITELKQVEAQLRESEARFQIALKNSPIVVFNQDSELRYTWVYNPALGYCADSILGKKDGDMIDEFSAERLTEIKCQVLESGVGTREEVQIALAGEVYFYDLTVEPLRDSNDVVVGITCATTDISARKRQEAELKQLNETLESQVSERTAELETFFDALPDYIFVVERENMRMPFANNTIAKASGFETRQQMQGKTIFECFPPEFASRFAEQNLQVFESGETLHFQETITLPMGTIHFDTFKIPLKKPNGEVYALIGTSRDITELIDTKEALSKRTQELEIANKELELFSYSVSHDLRAPLRHILGFENALRKQLELSDALSDPKAVRYLDLIQNSSKKMGQLIEGMLTLSRLGRRELRPVPVNLRLLAENAFNLASSQRGTNEDRVIEFEVKEMPGAIADEALLQQVFTNLIANAVKFSRDRHPAQITVDSLSDGTIFVKDNGVGFDMKYADQLFGVFQRLHSQQDFEGTGIGLAIAQRIIHRHGGKIWAFSEPGQGATFYFKLLTVNG